MSDIALTRADIKKVREITYRKRDEWEGDEAAEASANTLLGFINVLLGQDTLDYFLRDQDMED